MCGRDNAVGLRARFTADPEAGEVRAEEARISGYLDAHALETRSEILRAQHRMLTSGSSGSGGDAPK